MNKDDRTVHQIVDDVPSLRTAFITAMPDCLLFASWQARDSEIDVEEVAAYFGDLVRSNRQGLKALKTWSAEMQITIESADSLILLREINADFILARHLRAHRTPRHGAPAPAPHDRAGDRPAAQGHHRRATEGRPGGRFSPALRARPSRHHAAYLSLRTGIPHEAFQSPDKLTPDQIARVEESACRLLGLKQLNPDQSPPWTESTLARCSQATISRSWRVSPSSTTATTTTSSTTRPSTMRSAKRPAPRCASGWRGPRAATCCGRSAPCSAPDAGRARRPGRRPAPLMGHGRLALATGPGGSGEATGTHLHYGFAWREKYGPQVRRESPADAFAAGFAAAACEFIEGLPPRQIVARDDASRCASNT